MLLCVTDGVYIVPAITINHTYMEYKRLVLFGVYLWAAIFIIFALFLFNPLTGDSVVAQHIGLWALLIPTVLLLSKWYFRKTDATIMNGLLLGLTGIAIGIILDFCITIPLFLSQDSGYVAGVTALYGNWMLYVGFAEVLFLTMFAGWEFDTTFTLPKDKK